MNRAFCNTCRTLVPAAREERDGRVFLTKDCPTCGRTEQMISGDSRRYNDKRKLDVGFDYRDCRLECLGCEHKKPNLVFLDLTNRCNMNCPICINNTPSMGFLFEPPMEYFRKVFEHFSHYDPPPAFQFFGGEPTVRKDLIEIIDLARSYKIPVRLVTNGLKLADPDYARQLVERRVTLLVAYDGANPEVYRVLRGNENVLKAKVRALDNVSALPRAKVVLMSLVAKDFNQDNLPELFKFCHDRPAVRGIYFMPLAHTWEKTTLDLELDRTTSEDVEQVVNDAFAGERIDFFPAGLIGQAPNMMKYLGLQRIPFGGAHPNCESMYVLLSDGEKYVPVARYLKHSTLDAAAGFIEAEKRLARKVCRMQTSLFGRTMAGLRLREPWLRLRARLMTGGFLLRHIKLGSVLKGRGPGKLWNAMMMPVDYLLRRKGQSAGLLARRTHIHGALQLIILPFEDRFVLETERMERCPAAFAFYNPKRDRVEHVPVCAWGLHKTEVMRAVSEHYRNAK